MFGVNPENELFTLRCDIEFVVKQSWDSSLLGFALRVVGQLYWNSERDLVS